VVIRPFLIGFLSVSLVGVAPVVVSSPAEASKRCVPRPVAHRGDSARAPENTRPAVRKALRAGAKRIEVDVRFTADDVAVLMHDPTVDRTTNGSGEIAALTRAQVRQLDAGRWFSRGYTGVHVPSLRSTLDYGRSRGAVFLLELKVLPNDAQMANLLADLQDTRMLDRVRVTSFDADAVLAVRAALPGVRTALTDQPRYRAPSSVLQFGRTYVVHHHSVTRDRIRRWHRAGITLRPWTVDSWRTWRRLARADAGPVITNRPKAYLEWARVYCS
jgi:glycerophosphoryl diester phosphodiesterase